MDKLKNYFMGDELPSSVWKGKYATKDEETPDDMHLRMAKEFGRIEAGYESKLQEIKSFHKFSEFFQANLVKEPLTSKRIYEDYFKDFRYIIPQGSIMSMLGNKYKVGSLSNCFVVPAPLDSYGGIFLTDQHLAQLMKRRGGVGTNLNKLRFAKAAVFNAAESSTGTTSFASRYSNTTREVAQDGRRGALMLMLSCLHPDIFDWVRMKDDRTKVTGANITTMLTDIFMAAAEADEDFICRFPIDTEIDLDPEAWAALEYNKISDRGEGIFVMKIRARELFDLIIEMAWKNGEPGLAFMDAIFNFSPDGVYEQFRAIASNPCGEQWLQAFDSCRLMALNLFSIVINPFTKESYIDYDKLYEISYMQQRLADDLVDLEIEYVKRIIKKIKSDPEPVEVKQVELDLWNNVLKTAQAGRRTGCGFTALADCLAAVGVKYDSPEGLLTIEQICHTKMQAELDCTIDMAIERGTFEGCDVNLEFEIEKMDNGEIDYFSGKNEFYQMLTDRFYPQCLRMIEHGRRNVSWSTVAPTGSLSIITKLIKYFNASAGVEPQFALWYFRNKKVNPNDENQRVDFIDQNGDAWQQYPVVMGAFKDWYEITHPDGKAIEDLSPKEVQEVFKESPWFGCTAPDIDWSKRIEIQAIVQRYTTNAISSTINLPENVAKEEVASIYWLAWKSGLKGITVYRDGSRTGVLVNKAVTREEFSQHDAPTRPESLDASIFHLKVKGADFTVAVGEMDGKPYEIFATEGIALKGCEKGSIRKKGKGRYHFICDEVDEAIAENMTDEQATITRIVSTALRHGTSVAFLAQQLNKSKGDITSFSKALARTLKSYIKDGEKIKGKCQDCGSENLIYREGCKTCQECGSSACGG